MSMDSSRSSPLLEKLTPPGSPRLPSTAFANTAARFRNRFPNIPSWVPSQPLQALQALLASLHAAAGPALARAPPAVATAVPMVTSWLLQFRLRRILSVYTLGFVFCLVVFNVTLFHHGDPQRRPPTHYASYSKGHPPPAAIGRPRSDFPHKIWQTWKINPLDFEPRDHDTARTWLERNPDYRYEVLTDGNEFAYVEYHFGPEGFNRPDIVEFYKKVKATIVRADLLRYMIMYAEGGTYADIDVEAIKPVSRFIPDRYDKKDIQMVIGVEIDEPDWKDHPILGPKSRSFCQWTFMSKPQMPIMMALIEQIMTWLNGVAAKQHVTIDDVNLDFDEIITGTGPSAFTAAILNYINEGRSKNNLITWDYFHDISESKLVSGVLVLTVEAFAAGQGHSDSGNHDSRSALVRHHYHASNWPSRHPRYRHPVYGEVEQCNWRDECVQQWDRDVAEFKDKPEEEQRRLIDEHNRKVKEEEERAEEERKKQAQAEEEERRRQEEEEKRRLAEEEDRKKKEEHQQQQPKPQ